MRFPPHRAKVQLGSVPNCTFFPVSLSFVIDIWYQEDNARGIIRSIVCLYLQQKYEKLSKCLVVFTICNLFASEVSLGTV